MHKINNHLLDIGKKSKMHWSLDYSNLSADLLIQKTRYEYENWWLSATDPKFNLAMYWKLTNELVDNL